VSDDAAPGTGQDAELARVFEQHRRHLRAIAYRMLGSLAEADDAVQETWLRFAAARTEDVENVSGWLTTIVTRGCLNVLRARAARPEQPAGMHVPAFRGNPIIAERRRP
jgi:RNA polymerase sigma-70 factor (ECF subfamily)